MQAQTAGEPRQTPYRLRVASCATTHRRTRFKQAGWRTTKTPKYALDTAVRQRIEIRRDYAARAVLVVELVEAHVVLGAEGGGKGGRVRRTGCVRLRAETGAIGRFRWKRKALGKRQVKAKEVKGFRSGFKGEAVRAEVRGKRLAQVKQLWFQHCKEHGALCIYEVC